VSAYRRVGEHGDCREPRPGAGGLRSVVAATAEELSFSHCLRGVASAVARPMADKCNAFGRQAERTLSHPSTTTLRRSCKQLPSRSHYLARPSRSSRQLRGGCYDGRRRSADAELWRPC